jgi:hypothetical protein
MVWACSKHKTIRKFGFETARKEITWKIYEILEDKTVTCSDDINWIVLAHNDAL